MDTNTYLLARLIQLQTGEEIEDIISQGNEFVKTQPLTLDQGSIIPEVEEIYKAYPTRCPVQGRNLGKCAKDKTRIKALLKVRSKESILAEIKRAKESGEWMKNFSTFLNNIPETEPEELFTEKTESIYK